VDGGEIASRVRGTSIKAGLETKDLEADEAMRRSGWMTGAMATMTERMWTKE
jgi:hypothetical protein